MNRDQQSTLPNHAAPTLGTDNPAKPLLMLIGGIYVLASPLTFLSGLQAGVHLMIGAVLMFLLGAGTIWLATRKFTAIVRIATMIWGTCLIGFFVFAAISAFDPTEIGGSVFFAAATLVVLPIPLLSAFQRPTELNLRAES